MTETKNQLLKEGLPREGGELKKKGSYLKERFLRGGRSHLNGNPGCRSCQLLGTKGGEEERKAKDGKGQDFFHWAYLEEGNLGRQGQGDQDLLISDRLI